MNGQHDSPVGAGSAGGAPTYSTGTTTVGVVADDGVVLAADRRASLGGRFVSNKRTVKVEQVHPRAAITLSGSVGGAQAYARQLRAQARLYETRRGEPMGMDALATAAGNALRGLPVSPLLGGVDVSSTSGRRTGSDDVDAVNPGCSSSTAPAASSRTTTAPPARARRSPSVGTPARYATTSRPSTSRGSRSTKGSTSRSRRWLSRATARSTPRERARRPSPSRPAGTSGWTRRRSATWSTRSGSVRRVR